MNNPAPIALFVYKRLEHTIRTVNALKQNKLAAQSKLYIFSDAADNPEDEAKINAVRKYIHTIDGFSEIEISEQEKNLGLAHSIISGVTKVVNEHRRVIVLEDDIVTSLNFLQYMNAALDYYQSHENIFSISGYTPKIKSPHDWKDPVFITQRASSWGWATWKECWDKADWDVHDFDNFITDKHAKAKFDHEGEDLTTMLKAQQKGVIDSWAVRWSYTHFKNNAYCLYPVKPKAKNIGIDNSGTHSKRTNKFDVELDNKTTEFDFPERPERNECIAKQITKLYNPSLLRKVINFIKLDLLK